MPDILEENINVITIEGQDEVLLRTATKPVEKFDQGLSDLLERMQMALSKNSGLGIAAPQIGVSLKIFLAYKDPENDEKAMVFINPEIIQKSTEIVISEEGCLSIPGIYAEVERSKQIIVRAQDRNAKYFEVNAEDLFAICIQHEYDHLSGVLFIDHLSKIKKNRAIRKFIELRDR